MACLTSIIIKIKIIVITIIIIIIIIINISDSIVSTIIMALQGALAVLSGVAGTTYYYTQGFVSDLVLNASLLHQI